MSDVSSVRSGRCVKSHTGERGKTLQICLFLPLGAQMLLTIRNQGSHVSLRHGAMMEECYVFHSFNPLEGRLGVGVRVR